MDIKKYIASGILEQYVLGFATEAERLEVEKNAQTYPEIQKELDAIELAMQQYAMIHEVEKPAGVEAKFNQRIDELSSKNPKPPTSNNSSTGNKSGGIWLPLILVGALLATGWWGLSNFNNNKNTQANLANTQQNLNTLQTSCDETSRENEALKERLRILQDPDNQAVKIAVDDNVYASIIWNSQTQKSYLFNTNKLTPPPAGKQYQLWAIVDGVPVDMKPIVLSTDDEALVEVDFIENPTAFAISLEDEGGNATPTQVIAVGAI